MRQMRPIDFSTIVLKSEVRWLVQRFYSLKRAFICGHLNCENSLQFHIWLPSMRETAKANFAKRHNAGWLIQGDPGGVSKSFFVTEWKNFSACLRA
ncbi:hypothetical protein TNCV_3351131 [Trichonephila clavipes]|nr:hypothetical protein TNCV_3351131 [Trichonephila clavipes]